MFTSPNAIAPFHIARAMDQFLFTALLDRRKPRTEPATRDPATREPRPYLHSAATCARVRMLSVRCAAEALTSAALVREVVSPCGCGSGNTMPGVTTGSRLAIVPVALMV